jgi:hypothetical protein
MSCLGFLFANHFKSLVKKEMIEEALLSTLTLLNNEVGSIGIDILKDEHLSVIGKVEMNLEEFNGST